MQANYDAMTIDQLKMLAFNRMLPLPPNISREDLIDTLTAHDLAGAHRMSPVMLQTLLPVKGDTFTTPSPTKQLVTPPRSPTRTMVPGAPRLNRVPTVNNPNPVPFRLPSPRNVPTIPMIPTQTKSPNGPILPAIPGQTRQPGVPIVPVAPTQVRSPGVPVAPTQVRSPGVPIVPVIPTQVRQPGVPIVPIPNRRIPLVPVIPGRQTDQVVHKPIIPVIPGPIGPSPKRINPPIPIILQNEPITPTVVRPTVQAVSPEDASVREKLEGATFDIYDFNWKETTKVANLQMIEDPVRFVTIFKDYQKFSFYQYGTTRTYVMEYLMTQATPDFLIRLITEMGFIHLNATIDVYYNLLWYLNIARNWDASHLTRKERGYISSLTEEGLLALLGPAYRGPQDKASLMFAVLSGRSAARPDLRDLPRYPTVSGYQPKTIWRLANDIYGLIDTQNRFYSLYPPYIHVALQPPSQIEAVVGAVTEANVDALIPQFGLVLPTQDIPRTQKEKVDFFIREISQYDPVFVRGEGTPPPPVLTGKTKAQVRAILAPYTLKEIVEAYEPVGRWTKRKKLIKVIYDEGRGGSIWSWRHRWCNNDDSVNIVTVETYGKMNKDDPQDPFLSYGVQKNYRCYPMSELVEAFREDDGMFHFYVPDWRAGVQDLTTGGPLIKYFPLESIRQLRELLLTPPGGVDVKPLADAIDRGLEAANNAAIRVRQLKTQYDAKPEDEKYIIRLYLAWLFAYGMWMRFWAGPGNPWPTGWVERGGRNGLCKIGRRDEHVFIQHSVRATINGAYERIPGVKDWIEALPLLDYNFRNGEVQIATGTTNSTIKAILDRIQEGDFCLAHGSDLVLKTSYYLIARLLNLTTEGEFNDFIDTMMPALLEIERQVVDYQLAQIKDKTKDNDRVRALEARRDQLARPAPKQPPFSPTEVGGTGHTDPRNFINFGD